MISDKYIRPVKRSWEAPACSVCGLPVAKQDAVKNPDGTLRHKTCRWKRDGQKKG